MSEEAIQGVSVSVRDLHKSFGDQVALRGVDLDVEPGEILVIMGASGSGKSVLLKHIIGLEIPDRGAIKINGHPIQETVSQHYRLAMVFQSGALLNSLTVGENVGLYLSEHRLKPKKEIERIVKEKLEVVGLHDQENRWPAELSGGMMKRVAIARALVIDPHLLLYDEPTSELDPIIAATIGKEIVKLKERSHLTSIVVTHDRDLAFGIADRIAIIHKGRILKTDVPERIRNSDDPVIREFLTVDFQHSPSKLDS